MRPDLQRYLLDKVTGLTCDTEQQLTIQTLSAHYETAPQRIQMPAWLMMSISNMCIENLTKIRFGMGDPLEEACKKIGTWDADTVAKAQKEQVLYCLTLNPRFIFKEKSMVICPASKCTVPMKLSSESKSGPGEGTLEQNVKVLKTLRGENQFQVMEELFRDLPNLRATSFMQLRDEFQAMYDQCSTGTHKNPVLSEKLKKGLSQINDFIETDSKTEEMLETMGAVLVSRSNHSKYLHVLMNGLMRLQKSRDAHAFQMERSEIELANLIQYSSTMQEPLKFRRAADKSGVLLRGDQLKAQIEKLEEKMANVKANDQKLLRYQLEDLVADGKVLSVYNDLETVPTTQIYLTLYAEPDGVKIHVGLNESKEKTNILEFVKVIFLPDNDIKKFFLAEKNDVVSLPLTGPILMKWKTLALAETLKHIT